jgi:Mrp family chromosome partitioning ATPase
MFMDLLLADDAAAAHLGFAAPGGGSHVARRHGGQRGPGVPGGYELGALDALLLDLPPGTDRLATVASLAPTLHGIIVVTILSEVSQLVVRRR